MFTTLFWCETMNSKGKSLAEQRPIKKEKKGPSRFNRQANPKDLQIDDKF